MIEVLFRLMLPGHCDAIETTKNIIRSIIVLNAELKLELMRFHLAK